MSVIIDSNICNTRILTSNLNVKLTGPTDVCWGKPYRYQAASFRQCYNTGCIPITRYEWAWDQGSPFKILNVENKDIVIESATIPFSGVHVLTVTAYDAENNSDVAFLNVNGTIGCTDTASVKIEGTTQACIDTEASFTANINHICNPICTSAITYIWKKNNDTIAVVDATDGQHQNYHTLQYTFTNTDIGINTISVEAVIAENVACANKFYTLLDSTDVCVLSCSPNAGVTLTPFPDTVTTNTPVGFRAEVDLKCNPECIPVESYTWTINGAPTTTQSDRRYNLIDYPGYGSSTADIVTVKVTDIQGNETIATTHVAALPPTTLINTFDVEVIAPTKLCKTQTGDLTYIAVVQPWYNSSGVKTDVASYDWTIKDSGGNIIGSRTYTTSSLKDEIVLTSNPQVTHRVTCIVRDAGGRSVTKFADVLAVDCVDSSTTDFTVEKKSGEENPCIGISYTYEVGVTIQNPCITPIIEKYEWYINGSLVRTAIKPNLSDTYDTPFSHTDPQDFRVVVTSEQGSTAVTTFTVTPKSCVSVNIIGADKFDCVGSEPPPGPINQNTYMYFFVDDSSGFNTTQVIKCIDDHIKPAVINFYNSRAEDFNKYCIVVDNSSERFLKWLQIDGNEHISTDSSNAQRWKFINEDVWRTGQPLKIQDDASNIMVFTFQNEAEEPGPARYYKSNGDIIINTDPQNNESGQYFVQDIVELISKWDNFESIDFLRACIVCFKDGTSTKYKEFVDKIVSSSTWAAQYPNYSLKKFYDNDLIYVSTQSFSDADTAKIIYDRAIYPAFLKFGVFGSRSQPDITCGPTGTHVRQIYTATTSSQTPIISYKWYTKKSSSNDWGDAIKTINGTDLANSDQAEISPDNKFQPIDIKVEVTDSNNYTATAFKNNIETIACPPGPPCLSNETYIWILVDITGSMDSAKTEVRKAIFGWQHGGVTYGGLMSKILTQAYGGDEAVFKQRVHVRMQANEAIIGWMNLSTPFIQSRDLDYVEQHWNNGYENSSSEVPPFFPLREADFSDPANPKPPGNVIILTISNESIGKDDDAEMGRYYNSDSTPYWYNTDTPTDWAEYMTKVTPLGYRGGAKIIGDMKENPGVLRYRGHIWNLRQTLNSIDATKTPGYFRGCFLLVNDSHGRTKGAFFKKYVFNEKYCTDPSFKDNHKADNVKDRGLWDYYMGNPASSKKWITASRPHLPNENKKGGIIAASSGESHDRILMNFKIINNQLRQLGFTSLTYEDDGGLVYGDL